MDAAWDCPGLETKVLVDATAGLWRATLAVPWAALAPGGEREISWRLNLFRIDRPRDGEPEFSAWSPTFVAPADFHRPARFASLRRILR